MRQRRRRLTQAKGRSGGRAPDRPAVVSRAEVEMSRAGLSPQVSTLLEDTLRIWDEAVAVSRAGLQRELAQALQVAARIVDGAGQGA